MRGATITLLGIEDILQTSDWSDGRPPLTAVVHTYVGQRNVLLCAPLRKNALLCIWDHYPLWWKHLCVRVPHITRVTVSNLLVAQSIVVAPVGYTEIFRFIKLRSTDIPSAPTPPRFIALAALSSTRGFSADRQYPWVLDKWRQADWSTLVNISRKSRLVLDELKRSTLIRNLRVDESFLVFVSLWMIGHI